MTNAMANVAAAALILPIVIPLAKLEGVDPRILSLGLGMATSFAMLLVIGLSAQCDILFVPAIQGV